MKSISDQLLDRIVPAQQPGAASTFPPLLPLLRLLATTGAPVSLDDLAAAAGLDVDDVRRRLEAVPDTEYDEAGRIVGLGLTLRTTPHRFHVYGHDLYTCTGSTCTATTFTPGVPWIRCSSRSSWTPRRPSASPASGTAVNLTVDPIRVSELSPETAVVSMVNPDDLTWVRASVCNQVHFFASHDDAQPWLDQHPDGEIMSVPDAHEWARRWAKRVS